MRDASTSTVPDHRSLYRIASEQQGYFTAAQARTSGFSWDLLTHHTHRGRFMRVRRGLYRLRDYPSSPTEEAMVAWLALGGKNKAVVSHQTALELLGLTDVIPTRVHVTVPRSRRNLPKLAGVAVHTISADLEPADLVIRDGIQMTSATRSVLDSAQDGLAPDQIDRAIAQAIERGMSTPAQLQNAAQKRTKRVRTLIENALFKSVR